jgi:hypothetical protein
MSFATDRAASTVLGLILLAASACGCSATDGTPEPADASPENGGSTGGGRSTGTGGGATGTGGSSGTGSGGATGTGGSSGTAGSAGRGGSTGSGGSTGGGGIADASTDVRPRDATTDVALRQFDAAPNCIAGDPQQALELQVVYRTTGSFMPVGAAPIQLIQPTQGGQVLYISVRARNIAGCSVTISTALVDTTTRAVVSLESRPIFLELGTDGWLQPRTPTVASNYSNLPACPRANLTRSIDDQTYELQVVLTDQQGRTGPASMNIVPTCGTGATSTLCHCQCAQNYVLGMPCN